MVVAERRPVLSRLVDEKSRPELKALGEIVVAALRAVHQVWATVTISDFVIMPDHVHFLLIVDYGRDKIVSPLFIAHRLADAVEMAVARGLCIGGAGTDGAPPRTPESPSQAMTPELTAMRRLELVGQMTQLLFEAIVAASAAELKVEGDLRFGELRGGECYGDAGLAKGVGNGIGEAGTARYVGCGAGTARCVGNGAGVVGSTRGSGARAPVRSIVFARDCYIELSFDARQLKATRHYIKLNPARALWKLRNPDLFLCHRAIKAARFAAFAPRRFDGIGALPILGSPFLFHVRLTLKKTIAEHAAAIEEIVEKARHGMVPVSGFISPGEKEALRRLKAEPFARFVKLLPYTLPSRYDPSAEDSREIAAGRLVILSAFHDTPAISSLDMKRNPAAAHRFRQNCLAMNDIAARLCC